jgi:hypothetical protein
MTTVTETATKVLLTFRDTMKSISPPWLQTGLAEKILYSLAIQCDAFGDALVAGVKQRFPGYYSFDSLVLLGRERRIERGLFEGDKAYASRLTQWLADHRRRGSGYALLSQVHLHYQPNSFPVDLVYYAGSVRFQMAADGTIVRDLVSWIPDTNRAKWARWWLFYYADNWESAAPTAEELQDLRLVPRAWNAAHCLGQLVLFPSTGELWNWPLGRSWNESGTWNTPGVVRFIDVEPVT